MKHRFTKVAASVAIAAGLVFAAPAMAQAYTPTGPDTVTVTVTASGPVSVTGFQPGASVTFTLVGEGVRQGNLAAVKFAVTYTTVTKTADSSGVATADVRNVPAGASWTLSATGARASSEAGGSGSLPLASTGGDSESLLGIWVGGGALVLAGATVAVAATVRRNRQETNA